MQQRKKRQQRDNGCASRWFIWDGCLIADGCLPSSDGCLPSNGCSAFDSCTVGCVGGPLRLMVIVGLMLYGEWPVQAPHQSDTPQ